MVLLVALSGWSGESSAAQTSDAPLSPFEREVSTFIKLLERAHYNRANVTPRDFPSIIGNFMAELDGQRAIFLQGDRIVLTERLGPTLYQRIASQGSTAAAAEIAGLYRERLRERSAWIQQELAREITFTTNETYSVDRSLAEWPADRAAADALWQRRLKFELLAEMMNDVPLEQARDNVRRRYERLASDFSSDDLGERFLTTVAQLFDQRSEYYSADTFVEFGLSLNSVTVGLTVTRYAGHVYVHQIEAGGAAERSGQIQAGDRLFAIAEGEGAPVEVSSLGARKIESMLRGPRGTAVRVFLETAAGPAAGTRRGVTLRRGDGGESTRIEGAAARVGSQSGGIELGVIRVPSFYGEIESARAETRTTSSQDLKRLLETLKARKVAGVVLDLRANGGGYLSESFATAGLFLGEKTLAHIKNYNGQVTREKGPKGEPFYGGPLVILVDKETASGAEIVAGALQVHRRAVMIGGSSTFGNGTIQQVLEMKQLSRQLVNANVSTGAARLTIQRFYLPNGVSTQHRGVVPDIILPSARDEIIRGESRIPGTLPWEELKVDDAPQQRDLFSHVRDKSRTRQSQLEEFGWLRDHVELQRAGLVREVSLNLATRLQQKAELARRGELIRARAQALPPSPFELQPIRYHHASPDTESASGGGSPAAGLEVDVPLREAIRVLSDMVAGN